MSLLLMHLTFYTHFMNMRSLGSRFSLGFAVLLNGSFALVISLVIARLSGISLSTFQLCEALPLLVVVVGFDKPYKLAKAIIEADGKSINDKIIQGTNDISGRLITDYMIEITILAIGGLSGKLITI